jgi:hypothetical protein
MTISEIRANGLDLPASGVRKAMDDLSRTPNPVDAVNLSSDAVVQSQKHIEYSLGVKTEKIQNEIASLTYDFRG